MRRESHTFLLAIRDLRVSAVSINIYTMKPRTQTIIVIIVTFVVLVVWDAYVMFFNDVRGDTESEVIRDWAMNGASAIPCVCGILMSHWFWPTNSEKLHNTLRIICFGLGLAALVNLTGIFVFDSPLWWPPVAVVIGIIYGKVFWSNIGPKVTP